MNNVRSQIYQNHGIQLNCLWIVLVTLVEHSTGLLRTLFLADSQTLINREVAAGDKVDNLRLILLVAEDFDELEQKVDVLLTGAVPCDSATIFTLLNDLLLVLLEHCVQEVVREVLLILEGACDRIVIAIKPLVT